MRPGRRSPARRAAYWPTRSCAAWWWRTSGHWAALRGRPPQTWLAVQQLVSWLSRGRLSAAHEGVLFILRKPEDWFARVLRSGRVQPIAWPGARRPCNLRRARQKQAVSCGSR